MPHFVPLQLAIGSLLQGAPNGHLHAPRSGKRRAVRNNWMPYVAAILLLCTTAAPLVRAQELPLTHYTPDSEVNPLSASGITRIYQDRLGYLWISAFGAGLDRYDGRQIDNFGYKDSLNARSTWALAEDAAGRLWVGSSDGISVSDGSLSGVQNEDSLTFTATYGGIPLPLAAVTTSSALISDAAGAIWTAPTGSSLLRFRDGDDRSATVDTIPLPDTREGHPGKAVSMVGRKDGSVWVSLAGGRMMVFPPSSLNYALLDSVGCDMNTAMAELSDGKMWGGCKSGKIWTADGTGDGIRGVFVPISYPGEVQTLLRDNSGTLWIGGIGGGLMRVNRDEAAPVFYTRKQGLLDDNIWDLLQDREGNIWIASNAGLSKMRDDYAAFSQFTGVSHVGERAALPGMDVTSVLPLLSVATSSPRDSLRFIVAGGPSGLSLISPDGTIEHVTEKEGLDSQLILNLCRDQEQGIWMATRLGVSRLTFRRGGIEAPGAIKNQSLTLFGRTAFLASYPIGFSGACQGMDLPDSVGSANTTNALCFAGDGLRCIVKGQWYIFMPESGLANGTTWGIWFDKDGHALIGSHQNGTFRSRKPLTIADFDSSVPQVIGKAPFRARNISTPLFETVIDSVENRGLDGLSVVVPLGDELWAIGATVLVLQGDPLGITTRLSQAQGFDGTPFGMAFAPRSNTLWVGSDRGLAEVDPQTRTLRRLLTKREGLVGNASWGPDAVKVGADGTVYYGTATGLSLYRPYLDRKNAFAPQPTFRRASFRQSRNGDNELNIEYAALSFADEKSVRYKTRLVGYDEQWSPEKSETQMRYTNLGAFFAAKEYSFEVIAANNDGLWSTTPLAYTVSVQPAWWLRWWAILFYAAALAIGFLVVDRVQRRRLTERERERSRLREGELRAEAAEARADYLRAENLRQTQELEAARELQLSMLPKRLPIHPMVEVAAFMQTATEVGGDYYDFHLSSDGTLTLTIGDATGHGLQAGTMVTAMKSLWTAFAQEAELEQVLRKSGRALRKMRLPKLYMALAVVRLRGQHVELIGAGMPPAVLFRSRDETSSVVPLKGVPLGGPGNVPYSRFSAELSPGDTLVLMSDGFPELRSPNGELFGYERAAQVTASLANRSATEIVAGLETLLAEWCDGTRPDDDVTFIILKMKERSE